MLKISSCTCNCNKKRHLILIVHWQVSPFTLHIPFEKSQFFVNLWGKKSIEIGEIIFQNQIWKRTSIQISTAFGCTFSGHAPLAIFLQPTNLYITYLNWEFTQFSPLLALFFPKRTYTVLPINNQPPDRLTKE